MTTRAKKTTRAAPKKKPAAPAKAKAAKPVSPLDDSTPVPEAAPAAKPTVVDAPQSVILGPVMRKKELLEQVVTRSGIKKKDAKPVVETMLAVLGEALADNRELVLPPFGKFKVQREKQLPNGRVMVVKLRQSTPPTSTGPDAAPDAAE